jgi:DNA-directed RNA polymerase subunit beta'
MRELVQLTSLINYMLSVNLIQTETKRHGCIISATVKRRLLLISILVKELYFGRKIRNKKKKGIYDLLKGKTGLLRGHLAGKRVDYSGRAVIVGDPSLGLDEIGIPELLWNKFFPADRNSEPPIVLINRPPTLHRNSFQSFRAIRHRDSNVIGMNPFVCKPFNADFDGDCVAVHVPRKPDAITEAEQLLPSHNLLSQANGMPVLGFEKDIALGAAYVTYHPNIKSDDEIPLTTEEELPLTGKDLWEIVIHQNIETTVGRLLLSA